MNNTIVFSDEIKEAFAKKLPVVAIETAGTYEGNPYPANMKLGDEIEETIRANGAVPAFIAIVDGVIKVGLTAEDKLRIANPPHMLVKASRRDIPIIVAKKECAVTAVAAAMVIAGICGIKVVSGGGIGGVHRDVVNSFDISADLEEFSKSNVLVVTSGAKSILDLPFTYEYLETKAVPVIAYGSDEIPAYLSRRSGIKADYRFDSPKEAADAFKVKNELGLAGGMLVANPIREEYSTDFEKSNHALEAAMEKVRANNIKGKVVTKYIMTEMEKALGPDMADSASIMNLDNAALAAQIACELNK